MLLELQRQVALQDEAERLQADIQANKLLLSNQSKESSTVKDISIPVVPLPDQRINRGVSGNVFFGKYWLYFVGSHMAIGYNCFKALKKNIDSNSIFCSGQISSIFSDNFLM